MAHGGDGIVIGGGGPAGELGCLPCQRWERPELDTGQQQGNREAQHLERPRWQNKCQYSDSKIGGSEIHERNCVPSTVPAIAASGNLGRPG